MSKTVKDYQGDPIHENVRMFERELKQKFPQLRVTSGFRKRAFTKQGNVSNHALGRALDLGYDKEIADYLANTYEGVGLLNKYGLGVLDESTKEVMGKTGATGAHLHVGMDSGLVAKAKERYKQLTPKENITPELTDFDYTPQTATFALENTNVEEEDAPKEEDKSKEVAQAKETLKEEQFMSDLFKGQIAPVQVAQEEAPQQAPQINLLESFANIESFVDSPLAQQGLTVPRKKMSLEELDAKMAQTRALLNNSKIPQSLRQKIQLDLKERPKEVVRENTQTAFRNEAGRQVNTNPNQQISTKHVNERRTESQIIADRKKAVAESVKAQDESIIGNPNWRQTLATQTQSTGDKFRIFPNEDSFIDNYLNPGVMIGDMARNLGQAPLQAQQQDSYMPYVTSVGTPLAVGAMAGYRTQGNTQFVNNLANPLAGTGDIFKSKINWGNINKEIVENPTLLKEYHDIERKAIADKTWMKNPDGSKFQGTPEEFVKINSQNFKKAYPDGFETTYRGQAIGTDIPMGGNRGYKSAVFTGDIEQAKTYAHNWKEPVFKKGITTSSDNTSSLNKLVYPKTPQDKILKINAGGKNWNEITNPEIFDSLKKYEKEYRIEEGNNFITTDDIADYVDRKGYDRGEVSDVIDISTGFSKKRTAKDKTSTTLIHNNKEGKYLKSVLGNNGMFDMNNPNIYKSIAPIGLGATYIATQGQEDIPKQQEGGYTEDEQRFITEYFQQGGIIKDNDKIEIKPSKIEGNGIFVTRDLKKGSSIGLAHTNNQPSTDLGKFHNHSENPNSESFKIDNNRFIITLRDLKKGEEVTVDYRKQPELEQPSDFKK